ncbi:MAG: GNAT family N-acetyltransferase [Nocardioidaceae bacterium]
MGRVEVRAFEDADIADAGRLLARRHQRHRAAVPLLSTRYEDPDAATEEVAKAWAAEDSSGAVALAAGSTVGYLIGSPKGDIWGPNVWIESAGQAVEEAEVVRDLYADAARRWYDEGRVAHYSLVPAQDEALLDAWYRLGFGQQQAHGIQPVPSAPVAPPDRVLVRPARRSDIPMLARLDVALPDHQGQSPVFSAGSTSTIEEAEAEWRDDFDNPDFTTFVAEVDGRVVGSTIASAIEKSASYVGPMRPHRAAFLGFAAVLPEARGLGAGRALGEQVLEWARQRGFASVVTDWRTTNLHSSRTWTRLGFRPVFLRLHRLIGH